MRTITEYTNEPRESEVIIVDGRANVFIREGIESYQNEDGETRYTAIEYSAQVNANKFELTEEFKNHLIQKEAGIEAAKVRAKRGELLAESDREVLPDRNNAQSEEYTAWAEYRQALRDIPEQEGFPYDIVWPAKPE